MFLPHAGNCLAHLSVYADVDRAEVVRHRESVGIAGLSQQLPCSFRIERDDPPVFELWVVLVNGDLRVRLRKSVRQSRQGSFR